ncbi:MAG TPA: hypothetical protein VM888_11365 [Chitinophagaceae bacterium]|nr:hypothetical protein [Chitinophagaceae bacterium]
MVKFYPVLLLIVFSSEGWGQAFSMGDLVNLTTFTSAKFDNYVSRRGFKSSSFTSASADSLSYNYFDKKARMVQPETFIAKYGAEDAAKVCFQTTSLEEFTKLNDQLKEQYNYTPKETNGIAAPVIYQKLNVSITPRVRTEGDKTVYSFLVEKKAVPKAKDIQYAEDLLQYTSHEYLVAGFGETNVKKDVFYFSDKEINKCSVLYPNTNQQVIFIWNDEANNRDISFILIGGQLRAQSSLTYHKQIELNSWQSRQGIRAGMSMKELRMMNGQQLKFYGWDSDQPGVLVNKTTGNLNFKNLGLVFNCFDCNEDKYYSANEILSSDDVLKENRRIYVSTLILLPDKK